MKRTARKWKRTGQVWTRSVGIAGFLALLLSCSGENPTVSKAPIEVQVPRSPTLPQAFTEAVPDGSFELRSVKLSGQNHQYYLRGPALYNADKAKSFPLVIYLHPWGVDNNPSKQKAGQPPAPQAILDLPQSKGHPAFVYVPVCPPPYFTKNEPGGSEGGEWNSPAAKMQVLSTIMDLRSRYHIDDTRIYLVGFSMGGSGAFYLGYEYYRVTGTPLAAVLRGAGWYLDQDPLREKIYSAISLSPSWIHIGEKEGRGYTVGMDTYQYFLEHFSQQESLPAVRDLGNGLVADERRLGLKNGQELRLSVYRGRDHEDLMFQDPQVIDWLFQQHR